MLSLYRLIKNALYGIWKKIERYLRIHPLSWWFSGTYKSHRQYTIISAIYQVEPYLEDFLKSIVKQTLSFQNNIQLILVDDGSTDRSAAVCKKWTQKYSDNMILIQKENGGQASARNQGLQHATGEWITFIDPDDFLNARYFEHVDRFLNKNHDKPLSFVGCKLFPYHEKNNAFKDKHPLTFKFKEGDITIPLHELNRHIHLSAASGFFQKVRIDAHNLIFDERIKVTFEDAHFINKYFLLNGDTYIGYVHKSLYFYRKRQEKTSTLDRAKQNPECFIPSLQYGSLDLLQEAAKLYQNQIPAYIQNTVLYDIIWKLTSILKNPATGTSLQSSAQSELIRLWKSCIQYIDPHILLNFSIRPTEYWIKLGLLSWVKTKHNLSINRAFISDVDKEKNLIRLTYYSTKTKDKPIKFYIDNHETEPTLTKIRCISLFQEDFIFEHIYWIPLTEKPQIIKALVNEQDIAIYLDETIQTEPLTLSAIAEKISSLER